MDANGELNVLVLVALLLLGVYQARRQPIPQHKSVLTGDLYYRELMSTVNVIRFFQVARMDKDTLNLLKGVLTGAGELKNSMYICAGQKIMILIYVLRGHTSRETAERWQPSSATISEKVHEVSSCLIGEKHLIFAPAKESDPVPTQIANSAKFSPFFNDCIGALDGTHIHAVILLALQGPYRNRKKFISQNVLGVPNFDLTFGYALFGWKGSAHDSRVLDDAKARGLPLLPGKYYLADCGYGLGKFKNSV